MMLSPMALNRGYASQSALLGPFDCSSIRDRAGCIAVAIDAVGPRAQHSDVLASNLLCAIKRELLIAAANAQPCSYFYRNLTTRYEARARYASA
jgi:hypothetical protein